MIPELLAFSSPNCLLTNGSRFLSAGRDDSYALLSDDGGVITYGQLRAEVCRLGDIFGSGKKLILIVAGNDADTVATYLAALNSGHAVILVAPEPASLIDHVCQHYNPHFICYRAGSEWRVEERHSVQLALHPELACMLSTSGTTGEGKFVRLSYRNLVCNALSIVEYLEIGEQDRFLLNLPINYSYGLSILNSHFVAGACVLASERSVTDPELWDFFRRSKGSGFAGVPHTYKLLDASKFDSLDLPTLRTMTQAGGRLPEPVARKFAKWAEEHDVRFFIMYGQTEASPRIAYLPPELAASHPDCIGKVIPGGVLELIDTDGNPITDAGKVGELQYSGPNVMMGYATQLCDLAEQPGPAMLRTGDMAMLNSEGLFKITGREKRFLKIYGLRISLDEIERKLEAQHVKALCGGSDEYLGVMTADCESSDWCLLSQASRASGLPQSVVRLVRVEELPLLKSGKIDYQRANEIFRDTRVTSANVGSNRAHAVDGSSRIRSVFADNFPGRVIQPTDSFVSLGGDSLTYVSVAVSLEGLIERLPDNWEKLSLFELEALALMAPDRSTEVRKSRGIEMSIFLRAIATVYVVVNHALGGGLEGGAALLMAVVGMNFARFQRVQLIGGRQRDVMRSFLGNVLVPYYMVIVGFAGVTGHIRLSDMLLVASFDMRPPSIPIPFGTWFIQVIAQILLLMALAFKLGPVRAMAASRPFYFGLWLLFLGLVARLFESVFWHYAGSNLGGGIAMVAWLFALGVMVAVAETPREKLLLSVLALILPWIFHSGEISRPTVVALGCMLAIWVPRVTLPRHVAVAVGALASASMFVYMLHQLLSLNPVTLHWPAEAQIVGGIALGTIGWWVFGKAQERLQMILDRSSDRRRGSASSDSP